MNRFITPIVATLAAMCTPAIAQQNCNLMPIIVENLAGQYDETVSGIYQSENSRVFVFTNEETQTWTFVVLQAGTDTGCIVAAGTGFIALTPEPQGDPA